MAAMSLICGDFLIENSLKASAWGCKSFLRGGKQFELCVYAKRGNLTDKSNGNSMWFTFDKCVPNSENYTSEVEGDGIAMTHYRFIIWNYCNKGWAGFN